MTISCKKYWTVTGILNMRILGLEERSPAGNAHKHISPLK
jgi:hypothetical protein